MISAREWLEWRLEELTTALEAAESMAPQVEQLGVEGDVSEYVEGFSVEVWDRFEELMMALREEIELVRSELEVH